MTKEEVQQRVLQNGKPLDLDKFTWNEETNTFVTKENGLVLNFKNISWSIFTTCCCCYFNTGSYCTFNTDDGCYFNTGSYCTFNTDDGCYFNTGSYCTFNTGSNCKFDTRYNCEFKTCDFCIFTTLSDCKFNTSNNCTFNTGSNCTFNTDSRCIFATGSYCTFITGFDCIFKTFVDCTFNTNDNCTFITGSNCNFNIGDNCVIKTRGKAFVTRFTNNTVFIITNFDDINKIYESNDLPKENLLLLTFNNIQKKPLKEVEIIDNFVEVILNKKNKGNIIIRKTIEIDDYFNHENFTRYVVSKGEFNAHGETIKKAIKDLEFKILSSKGVEENVKRVLKDNKVTFNDYRLITGSCELGTKDWFDKNNFSYDMEVTVEKAIELVTKTNAYANDIFIEAIEKYKGEMKNGI